MENYIVINGKKAELTAEQLEKLGIVGEKGSPFNRKINEDYFYISSFGKIRQTRDVDIDTDNENYQTANYCHDEHLLQQQAYRETLNRLLWRYSMEHEGEKIDWKDSKCEKYKLYYNSVAQRWFVTVDNYQKHNSQYFYTRAIAEQAIKEIVKPFVAERPDFKL